MTRVFRYSAVLILVASAILFATGIQLPHSAAAPAAAAAEQSDTTAPAQPAQSDAAATQTQPAQSDNAAAPAQPATTNEAAQPEATPDKSEAPAEATPASTPAAAESPAANTNPAAAPAATTQPTTPEKPVTPPAPVKPSATTLAKPKSSMPLKPVIVKPAARTASDPHKLAEDEQEFMRLVNEERAKRGLCKLTLDPILVTAARQHSREMSDLHYFDHFSPVRALRSPLERYGAALGTMRYTCTVGENLFYCTVRDIPLGHRSLMESPGHRANILAWDYRYIGVGSYQAANGEYYVTEMFHT